MPRPAKAPRLYLFRSATRPPTWVIRDMSRMVRTGAAAHETEKARECLKQYLFDRDLPSEWVPDSPAHRTLRPTNIYFATCDAPDFPIKIGMAFNVRRRMVVLQVSLPYKLILLATMPGTQADEHRLHIGFYQSRLEGEWFARTPELMALISSLRPARAITAEARP